MLLVFHVLSTWYSGGSLYMLYTVEGNILAAPTSTSPIFILAKQQKLSPDMMYPPLEGFYRNITRLLLLCGDSAQKLSISMHLN